MKTNINTEFYEISSIYINKITIYDSPKKKLTC